MKQSTGKSLFSLFFVLSLCTGVPAASFPTNPAVASAPLELRRIAAARPDVHFVPTPMAVVQKMLEMAGVDENDRVYDLGSGDGRIVITAARERGARGVGIDIDPERIRESAANAEIAGVSGRVRFLQQNLFEADLSGASVVTLYLLPWINLELRPKLLQELRPGTRIVSHAFDMGDWEPDEFEIVEGDHVYFWIVPANVSGIWEWRSDLPEGSTDYRLELAQEFQYVSGTIRIDGRSSHLEDTRLVGDRFEFTVEQEVDGHAALVHYKGRVRGDAMEIAAPRTAAGTTAWRARRAPETMASLAE